jgi:hypothetical protein
VDEKRRHIEDEAAQLYEKLNQYSAEEESQCTYPFKRKKHVYFNKPRPPPDEPWQYTENVERYRYTCRKLSSCLGLSRRRVGRGGRFVPYRILFIGLDFVLCRWLQMWLKVSELCLEFS